MGRKSWGTELASDFGYLVIDSAILRAHRQAAGARKGPRIRPSAAPASARAPGSALLSVASAVPSASS
ncbi:hypothetical protein E2C06_00825 [Dankookia rubra]|uniref:Transposase n=1 Tax=Dankookia rubra TaxID=1442381 RepID=A0A4R5QLW2_9PROT|nr:hypothetical protein E2C06_00825 [Dankookia rubra]